MERVISRKASLLPVQTRRRDRTTFEELYTTYLPKVYNYVRYRVSDVDVAEDITAAIFERALTRLHTYRSDRGAFSTWLFTIARHVISNHLRDRERKPEMCSLNSLPPLSTTDLSPEQTVIEAEQLQHVQRCMQRLPERQQDVLALKFGSGLSYKEIAQTMKIKPNYVGVLLHRAVRALRQALEEEGVVG
jgi:RNA polymerase sigma-70 factor, ECF subfamily